MKIEHLNIVAPHNSYVICEGKRATYPLITGITEYIDTTHDATYLTSTPEYFSTFRIPFFNSISESKLVNCSLISTNTYRNETSIKKLLNNCLKVDRLSYIKVSGRIRVESEGAANYTIHVAVMDAEDLSDLSKAVDLQAIDATVGTGYNTVYFDFDCEITNKKGILFYYCTSNSAAQRPRIYARNVSLQTTVIT